MLTSVDIRLGLLQHYAWLSQLQCRYYVAMSICTAEVLDSALESAFRTTQILVDGHVHVATVAREGLRFGVAARAPPLVLRHVQLDLDNILLVLLRRYRFVAWINRSSYFFGCSP